ncbi:MAG: hypothetical protein IJM76_00155 [Lachnospiraceae bacterium]|nr:hypothetical protein [Lachnospiraceae bacterium]
MQNCLLNRKGILKISIMLLLMILIFSSCVKEKLDDLETRDTEQESAGLQIPDEIAALNNDPNLVWSAGIFVALNNLTPNESVVNLGCDAYLYQRGNIDARIDVGSGLEREQSFSIMILADGRPISFSVDGTSYIALPLVLAGGTKSVEASFDPGIPSGRLDFVLIFHGDRSFARNLVSWTAYLGDPAEAANVRAEELIETVPQIAPVRNMAGGYTNFAMLRVPEEPDEAFEYKEGASVTVGNDQRAMLDIVSGYEGQFRTVCFVGTEAVSFSQNGKKYDSFVWNSTPEMMIHEIITLDLPDEFEGQRFYTISVPLDRESSNLPPLISAQYILLENKE